MYDRDNNGMHVRFASWGELLDYAKGDVHAAWAGKQELGYCRERNRAAWSGTDTLAEAYTLAENGWPEGERLAKDLSDKLMPGILSGITRDDWRYDVEGSTFDVARYVEGEPEHWIAPDETFEHGMRTVRIVANNAVSAAIPTATMIRRGVAVSALVEALTYAGIKVELWLASALCTGTARFELFALIKNADQPLEPSRVAFAFAHPASFRRIVMSATTRSAIFQPSHGYPAEALDWESGKPFADDEHTIYFKQAHLNDPTFATLESTTAWIFDTLAKYGVQIRGINAD